MGTQFGARSAWSRRLIGKKLGRIQFEWAQSENNLQLK